MKVTGKRMRRLTVTYILLSVIGIVMVYPLLWIVSASFKTNREIFSSLSLICGGDSVGWIFRRLAEQRTVYLCHLFHKYLPYGDSYSGSYGHVQPSGGLWLCKVSL